MLKQLIDKLESELNIAIEQAFNDIITSCNNEHLYSGGLFTNDALHAISLIANTEEQLKKTVKYYNETVDKEYDITSTINGMRWSYGDWGIQDVGSEHFSEVNEILFEIDKQLNDVDEDLVDDYYDKLWNIVLAGFKSLNDNKYLKKHNRSDITLLVCGDFYDDFIDKCARNLNPPDVAERYISWDPDK